MSHVICLDSSDEESTIAKDLPRKKRRIQPTPVKEDINEPVVTPEQASALLTECTLTPIITIKHDENIETVSIKSDDEANNVDSDNENIIDDSLEFTKTPGKHKHQNRVSDLVSNGLDLSLDSPKDDSLLNLYENKEIINLADEDLTTESSHTKTKESFVKIIHGLKLNGTNCSNIDLVNLSDDEVEDKASCPETSLVEKYDQQESNILLSTKEHTEQKLDENLETVSLDATDSEDEKLRIAVCSNDAASSSDTLLFENHVPPDQENNKSISIKENTQHRGDEITETVSLDASDSEDEKSRIAITGLNSDSSIIINDSDTESSEKGKENHIINGQILDKQKPKETANPSTSKGEDDICETKLALKKFLDLVNNKIFGSQFEKGISRKVRVIEKYFNKCGENAKHKSFINLLHESITHTENGTAATAVISFHKVFEHLRLLSGRATVEIEEHYVPVLKKLEKTIKLLTRKIKQLEETEINFDDDEDSTYIQADKYQKRLNIVYAKYCKYIRKSPYSGRLTYDKINFCNSSYNEINLAINRKYKNSLKFPSYYELEKYIGKVSKKENLNLTESEIKYESGKCFKHLGRILQKRRKTELYECHVDFIQNTEDPASKDIHLENTLKKNWVEGESRIEKLCQRYSAKQDLGEDNVSTSPGSSDCSENEQPT